MNNNGFYVSLITINDYCYTVICIYKFIVFVYNLFSPFFYALHVNATKFIFPRHYFFARDYFRSITTENRCSLEYSLTGLMYNLIKKIYIYIFYRNKWCAKDRRIENKLYYWMSSRTNMCIPIFGLHLCHVDIINII